MSRAPKLFDSRMKIRVQPGEYHASEKDVVLITLLGSCVSACLYDPVNHVVGMNHFLLSTQSYSSQDLMLKSDAGRYGINAMELLINRMMKLGAQRKHLKAKVFGGAAVLQINQQAAPMLDVGGRNARFVVNFLQEDRIPVVAADLEGVFGRVIYFDSRDYSVYVRKVQRTEVSEVVERDRSFIRAVQREREQQHRPQRPVDVDLWD